MKSHWKSYGVHRELYSSLSLTKTNEGRFGTQKRNLSKKIIVVHPSVNR